MLHDYINQTKDGRPVNVVLGDLVAHVSSSASMWDCQE